MSETIFQGEIVGKLRKPAIDLEILPLHIKVDGGDTVVYIGEPRDGINPAYFQSKCIQIPAEILASLQKLEDLSLENNIPLVDLCRYALEDGAANNTKGAEQGSSKGDAQENTLLSIMDEEDFLDNKLSDSPDAEKKEEILVVDAKASSKKSIKKSTKKRTKAAATDESLNVLEEKKEKKSRSKKKKTEE